MQIDGAERAGWETERTGVRERGMIARRERWAKRFSVVVGTGRLLELGPELRRGALGSAVGEVEEFFDTVFLGTLGVVRGRGNALDALIVVMLEWGAGFGLGAFFF